MASTAPLRAPVMAWLRTGTYTVLLSGEKSAIPVKAGRIRLPLVNLRGVIHEEDFIGILVINQRRGEAGGFYLECQRSSYRYRDWNAGYDLACRARGLRGVGCRVVLGIHDLQVARIGIADKSAMRHLAGRRGGTTAAPAARRNKHND